MEQRRATELDFLKRQTRNEELHLARAKVDEANGRVALASAHLSATAITAPTDGRVVEVLKHAGDGVSNTMPEPILLFVPEGPMEVRAEIDESFWGRFKTGDRVRIRTSFGQHTEGRVRVIKPLMGQKNVFARSATERMDLKIFETWIELSDVKNWPVGMEVRVEIGN
jgi:multidrug resistance efflux pump